MQIKCRNVITLAATNVDELEIEWDCLLDTQESGLMRAKPFVTKHLRTAFSDVCLSPFHCECVLLFKSVCGKIYFHGYDCFKINLVMHEPFFSCFLSSLFCTFWLLPSGPVLYLSITSFN
jgi:hypothetical protein